MHVIFVSASELKSIKRTRTVLDSYAVRSGQHSWHTPITEEALREVRTALRRSATRYTAVACYQNEGRNRMRLLWTVGRSSAFGPEGQYPIATKRNKQKRIYPNWLKEVCTLASAGGITHDLGKFNIPFASKLKSALPIADSIRHEWISMKLLAALAEGKAWDEAWRTLSRIEHIGVFANPLSSAMAVLEYIVGTHHKLVVEDAKGGNRVVTTNNHIRDASVVPTPIGAPSLQVLKKLHKYLDEISKMGGEPLYWRGVALLSRAALILADHLVSSQNHCGKKAHLSAVAYANTVKDKNGNPQMNQDLSWHLLNVSKTAGWIAEQMAFYHPPELSAGGIAAIDQVATGQFEWQESAASVLRGLANEGEPSLVYNVAGTGSGKTRMNARAIVALRGGRHIRFATVLNLRTLTLQTGDAYLEQIGIGSDELATVIGDKTTKILHQASKSESQMEDTDGNAAEDEFEVTGECDPLPDWIEGFLHKSPNMRPVIGAPVLVATADYLVNAGEPHKQGHHALALLRLMTSDLIIDEADGYDPGPLAAMLRLVHLSAFFGRHVVVSSATLSYPVAEAIYRAFEHGIAMRTALHKAKVQGRYAIIHDEVPPRTGTITTLQPFIADYTAAIGEVAAVLNNKPVIRWPTLVDIPTLSINGWHHAISNAAEELHQNNHFVDDKSGKRISVGLVRIANIKGAIPVARHLAASLPNARVCCYHSQLFTLHRYNIEKRLDFLLNRKGDYPNARMLNDAAIRKIIDEHEGPDLMLIVVATPVEEIGRDHDFDYAVVEPSSASSLVQVAGRVQRHRRYSAVAPNVGILRFNRNAILGVSPCFSRPGLEKQDSGSYGTVDMADLLDWPTLRSLDAAIRFGPHLLSVYDDRNARVAIHEPLTRVLGEDKVGNLWMSENSYKGEYALRPHSGGTEEWRINQESLEFSRIERNDYKKYVPILKEVRVTDRAKNDLFVLSFQEIAELAEEVGIAEDEAFKFKARALSSEKEGDNGKLKADLSFGMSYP